MDTPKTPQLDPATTPEPEPVPVITPPEVAPGSDAPIINGKARGDLK